MNNTLKISAVLFAGLWITGCAMPAGGMTVKRTMAYNPPQTHVIYSNEAGPEFINGVEDMALSLLTCDSITKASKPPLIVIRPLETEGNIPFDTKKYAETERSILMGKAGDKVRFIDKETTEEANYYLYGVISSANTMPSNNPGGRRKYSTQSAQILEQSSASNQNTSNNKTYRFTMSLFDPRSNATLWKDECGFAPEEIQQHNHSK